MTFKAMDPDLARELIAQHQDVLTPAMEAEASVYERARCPVCGEAGCSKKIDAPRLVETTAGVQIVTAFGEGLLPKGYALCRHCETEFDPETSVIRKGAPVVIRGPHPDPHST
jgi:hypothetical protein